MTVNLPPPLQQAGSNIVTERASDDPERKTAAPNARSVANRSLAFGQLLDSKGRERSERTERRNPGSFYSVGRRVVLRARSVAEGTTDANDAKELALRRLRQYQAVEIKGP